jgi:hypothetical protein
MSERWLRHRGTCEAPASELSSGPASTDASEAGYICRSPILNPKAKTPLATQGESIYQSREKVTTLLVSCYIRGLY